VVGGDPAGGSYGLAGLIDEHGESVLADLQEYYSLNLVDMLRPGSGYSPLHILTLLRQLPVESRTMSALRGGPQFRGWDTKQYFLASLIDAVRENTYAFICSNIQKKSDLPPAPEPVETPDHPAKSKKPKQNAFAQMAARQLAAARKAKENKGA